MSYRPKIGKTVYLLQESAELGLNTGNKDTELGLGLPPETSSDGCSFYIELALACRKTGNVQRNLVLALDLKIRPRRTHGAVAHQTL